MTKSRPNLKQLQETIEHAAAQSPGVLRIEPSIAELLINLRTALQKKIATPDRSPTGSGPTRPGGVQINLSGERLAVKLDIATDSEFSATTVAEHLRRHISEIITKAGLQPGPVDINILAIETT